jgi:hypothetical protein
MSRNPEGARDSSQHDGGMSNRREVDEGNAVGQRIAGIRRSGAGEAGFTHATGTRQGQQVNTGITQQHDHGGQLLVAGDEVRQRNRQVRAGAIPKGAGQREPWGRAATVPRLDSGYGGPGSHV